MGAGSSSAIPTDESLLTPHTPGSSCTMSLSLKANKAYDFDVPQNLWNTFSPNPCKTVDSLHLEFVPDGKSKCLVRSQTDGDIVAVLLTGHRQVQICGFLPAAARTDDRSGSACGMKEKHDGRTLYEWAKVQRHYKNGTVSYDKFEIRIKGDDCTTFVIKPYKGNFIVKESGQKSKTPVAFIEKQQKHHQQQSNKNNCWRVRCCPGIDPTMMACMTVSLDKVKDMFYNDEVRSQKVSLCNQRGVGI